MAPEKIDRRLAAILSADVVGYSRLMGADEAGTLSDLQAHHAELIDPTIAAHNGRVVKLMGDGVLVEFASVVDAVECAVAIQRSLIERNVKIQSNRRIELRIGINVGDVIVTDDDIFGDSVNVAARLQEFAEPGSVCVSGTAFDQIEGKLEHDFVELGRQLQGQSDPRTGCRPDGNLAVLRRQDGRQPGQSLGEDLAAVRGGDRNSAQNRF